MSGTKKKGLKESEIKTIKGLLSDLKKHLDSPKANAGFGYFQAVDCEDDLNKLSIKKAFLNLFAYLFNLSADTASLGGYKEIRRGDLRYMISLLQLTLFAIEMKNDPEQLKNLSDNSRLLVEHYYPNEDNFPDLKTKLFDCYYYVMFYFACVNMVTAFKKVTGLNKEFDEIASYARINKIAFSFRGRSFGEIYRHYEESSKNVETDFCFMLACLKELKKKLPKDFRFSIPCFEISKFRPKDENIQKCIDEILNNSDDLLMTYEHGQIKELSTALDNELILFERKEMHYY